jgi:hypothetical protein
MRRRRNRKGLTVNSTENTMTMVVPASTEPTTIRVSKPVGTPQFLVQTEARLEFPAEKTVDSEPPDPLK